MYIKEDLIIPHVRAHQRVQAGNAASSQPVFVFQHHSFYDFIVTKARGKSGESTSKQEKL